MKKKLENSYENQKQSNKKYRAKSKKLEKREKLRKSKKKTKKEKHYLLEIKKYILKAFKKESKYIHFDTLPFELIEIEKELKRLIEISPSSKNEIIELINNMEENAIEVDVRKIQNKLVQTCLVKLFKRLRIFASEGNPFIFKIRKIKKRQYRERFTTEESEIIDDSLESYSLFIKSFINFIQIQREKENEEKKKIEEEEIEEENMSNIDKEYEEVEKTVGMNSELINKAFNFMMRNDDTKERSIKKLDDDILDNYHSRNLYRKVIVNENTTLNDNNDCFNKNKNSNNNYKSFLKNTLNLISNSDNIDNKEII